MGGVLIATLRHNIALESDICLAEAELRVLSGLHEGAALRRLSSRDELEAYARSLGANGAELELLTHTLRDEGTIALVVEGLNPKKFEGIILRASFLQDLLFRSVGDYKPSRMAQKLSRARVEQEKNLVRAITLCAVLEYSAKLVSNREKGSHVNEVLDALVNYLLDGKVPNTSSLRSVRAAIDARKTTLYLTHELHLYKGKFFPRLVRSLINRYADGPDSIIADPFVGSGTTLLEASLLGFKSIGIDVDPTSVMISSEKLSLVGVEPSRMWRLCNDMLAATTDDLSLFANGSLSLHGWERYKVEAPEPMRGRLRKRGNEEGYDLLGEVENDSAKARCLIAQIPEDLRPIYRVCLSHALTKKLRLRFVGIGNGRFTIDVAKVGVLELFLKKSFHVLALAEIFHWLDQSGAEFVQPQVIRGSAKSFSDIVKSPVQLVVTSPPYIPASSGREHYARARAIPLVFSDAATVDELDRLDGDFIGEMSASSDVGSDIVMPTSIRRTLDFLSSDEQRRPKFLPTQNYYLDSLSVLKSINERLRDDGKAIFVVAKSHTFYVHHSKKILHTADAATAMADLGKLAGLKIKEVIDIPLHKSGGLNARPRSTDDYSEAAIVFEK